MAVACVERKWLEGIKQQHTWNGCSWLGSGSTGLYLLATHSGSNSRNCFGPISVFLNLNHHLEPKSQLFMTFHKHKPQRKWEKKRFLMCNEALIFQQFFLSEKSFGMDLEFGFRVCGKLGQHYLSQN